MTLIEAKTDEEMEFEGGRYHLTKKFIKDRVDGSENVIDDGKLMKRSRKNSRLVYAYIMGHCHSSNWKTVQFLINGTQEGKDLIKEALATQLEADLLSGYNDLGTMPADEKTKRDDIRENQITVETEQILESSVSALGVNILSMAPFPPCYVNYIRRIR